MPRDVSSLRALRRRPANLAVLSGFLVRVLLLATMAIGGSVWALVRFYTHVRPPMRVPVPAATSDWPEDAGVIAAPGIEDDAG